MLRGRKGKGEDGAGATPITVQELFPHWNERRTVRNLVQRVVRVLGVYVCLNPNLNQRKLFPVKSKSRLQIFSTKTVDHSR